MTSSIPVVNNAPLLDVRDLCVDFVNGSAVTHAVRGVSFQLGHEKLAIVGESRETVMILSSGQRIDTACRRAG